MTVVLNKVKYFIYIKCWQREKMMMKKITCVLLAGLMSVGGDIFAEDYSPPFAAENFSATMTFTTDYIFRGISFSGQDPAIQGSIDWSYNGFYAGVWGSNLELGDGSIEIDYYGGYASSIGPIDYDIMGIYYSFPSTSEGSVDDVDPEYFETWVTLSHTFADISLEPTVSLFWAWSPDFSGEDGSAHYLQGNLGLSLPYRISLDFGYGNQDISGDKTTPGGLNYDYWNIGISKEVLGFDLDIRYHDTDENKALVGYTENGSLVDERVVFTVSRSF